MKAPEKARRPRERTARMNAVADSLAGYPREFRGSTVLGNGALEVRKPGTVAGIGSIEGAAIEEDRPIEFRARAVAEMREVVRSGDRAESTEILLADGEGGTLRISVRAPIGAVRKAIRVALFRLALNGTRE